MSDTPNMEAAAGFSGLAAGWKVEAWAGQDDSDPFEQTRAVINLARAHMALLTQLAAVRQERDNLQREHERLGAAYAELHREIATTRAALKECADELEALVEHHYPSDIRKYPSEQRRYERDIAPVKEARAILDTTEPTT